MNSRRDDLSFSFLLFIFSSFPYFSFLWFCSSPFSRDFSCLHRDWRCAHVYFDMFSLRTSSRGLGDLGVAFVFLVSLFLFSFLFSFVLFPLLPLLQIEYPESDDRFQSVLV